MAEAHHEHPAPHGGTLVELGDEFGHIEFVIDRATGDITAYVLDGEAEQAVRVSQSTLPIVLDGPTSLAGRPLELRPVTSALTGERAGDASEFTFTDSRLRAASGLSGMVLSIGIRGQSFREVRFMIPPP